MAAPRKAPKRKTINLALQGGGAHGAFTWGVLDALLEDGRLDFEGVTAASAGAMNAAALAHGLTIGDRETARQVLFDLWNEISKVGAFFSPIRSLPWENGFDGKTAYEEALSFSMFEMFTNAFSPYQFNPFDLNPLRAILKKVVNIDAVNACDRLKLFITATNVRNGHPRVFTNEEMSHDVILASSCIPFLFQAVEIGGEHYWDGGYVGNPALWPLFYHTASEDICIVHINPIERDEVPKTPYDIKNRMNEITFNVSLLSELRAVAFVKKLIHKDMLKDKHKERFKDVLLHAIRADTELKDFSVVSKFSPDWSFLQGLRDRGRQAAFAWLNENYDAIGKRATVDIKDEFLDFHKTSKQKDV